MKASVLLLLLMPFAIRSRRALLLVPPLLFLAISMLARLNIGARHILPIWPFLIVAGAGGLWAIARERRYAQILLGALLLFHVASTATTAPNYIAYANELWGGTNTSHRVLRDSNVEWGQNLKLAREWLAQNNAGPCWFAAYGHGQLTEAQQPCRLLPALGWSNGRAVDAIPPVIQGTVLLSVTVLPPRGNLEYQPITSTQPVALIGGSVLVYQGTFRVTQLAALSHATRAAQFLNRGAKEDALREAQIAMQLAPEDPRVRRAFAMVSGRAGAQP
jgi:hypothetical protein